jgi:hypothetical protein
LPRSRVLHAEKSGTCARYWSGVFFEAIPTA